MGDIRIISVTYDASEKDFPMTMCFKRVDDENTKLLVGYVGNDATELYKCVTEQDYLKEHDAELLKRFCNIMKINLNPYTGNYGLGFNYDKMCEFMDKLQDTGLDNL